MAKSRASDQEKTQLKDFIAPIDINLNNCGKIVINKTTVPSPDPTDTSFGYKTTGGLLDTVAPTDEFNLKNGGTQTYNNVIAGTYTVTENDPSPLFSRTNLACTKTPSNGSSTFTTTPLTDRKATITLAPEETVECTFTNSLQQGALKILKNSTKTGTAVKTEGAVFSYDVDPNAPPAAGTVTDNGTGDEDPDVGEVCVPGLTKGDYTVDETSPPTGYGDSATAAQTAIVVAGTNCGANPPTGTGVVTFTNPPLTDIQVNFRDRSSDETALDEPLSCTNTTGTASTTTATGWDNTRTVTGIQVPDTNVVTVTCTIKIDPLAKKGVNH